MKKILWRVLLVALFCGGVYVLKPAWAATWIGLWVILNRIALVQRQQVELATIVKKAHELQVTNQRTLLQAIERLRH